MRRHTSLSFVWRRRFATSSHHPVVSSVVPPLTYIEKVFSRHAVVESQVNGKKDVIRSGDYVMIRPAYVMTHDNTNPVISKFKAIGATRIKDPGQAVFCLDHDVQNKSDANLKKYANIEAWAHEQGVDFYPAGRGIGHQIMVEEGYAWPGELTVANDSHSNMYGGVGCVGTPIVRTDAAAIWATTRTWMQVPPVIRVLLRGELPRGVTGKDIILALCAYFNKDEVLNAAIEFHGDGVAQLSVEERLAIANMTTEWGAIAGVFPVDQVLVNWYKSLSAKYELQQFSGHSLRSPISHPRINPARVSSLSVSPPAPADAAASYVATLTLDLSSLTPHVSGPNSVKISTPLSKLEKERVRINKAYLVSCTNSRLPDLQAAAKVLRGKKVAAGVEFYVAAASSAVQREAEEDGTWGALCTAGAKTLPAGCGPCIGLGVGLLEEGETGISATNRNYKGRMGSPNALAYLASPEVVAASALRGYISGPISLDAADVRWTKEATSAATAAEGGRGEILPNFPQHFEGPLLFVPADNLNTDGIYPGKYTYQDDITLARQAEVVMENYDTSFAPLVASLRHSPRPPRESGRGILLASGLNFGTGSSREQAATALLSAGIQLVICESFGDIFKRNSINNGLICVLAPDFIHHLTSSFTAENQRKGEPTVNTKWFVEYDPAEGQLRVWKSGEKGNGPFETFRAGKVGRAVQEIWTAGGRGGLEQWVKEKIGEEK
ncbi:homoaconitase [Atractiella rhizophila]|nr:homoaconitase [Atractiella rhizophila]